MYDSPSVAEQTLRVEGIVIPNYERLAIKGEIIKMKWEDLFSPPTSCMRERSLSSNSVTPGFPPGRYMMTVQINGYKTYGAVPKALLKLANEHGLDPKDFIGATIKFMATITPSRRDPSFTFFKRPAKFEMDDASLAMTILQKDF